MRRFKPHAVSAFKEWIIGGKPHDPAMLQRFADMLNDDLHSEPLRGAKAAPHCAPVSRYELGRSVAEALAGFNVAVCLDDEGLVYWLDVHFRAVTFHGPKGDFVVGDAHRHVFWDDARYQMSSTLRHRNLVRTCIQIAFERGELGEGIMLNHPSEPSKAEENYISRKGSEFSFLRSDVFFRVANTLFVGTDRVTGRKFPRKGAQKAFVRLIEVGAQLDATFDLGSMPCDELLGILPTEFDRWKAAA